MFTSILDLFEIESKYREYLLSKHVLFDKNDRPVFQKNMFLDSWPETVVTFHNRNNKKLVRNPKSTVICFFESDSNIHVRLEKVFDDLEEYKRFMAVAGIDMTITADMDKELQDLIVSINYMFMMILAINGIKILFNTRSGSLDIYSLFGCVPRGIMVVSGFLGCEKLKEDNLTYLKKIICLYPSKTLIYGKSDCNAEEQLDRFGFEYRRYRDVHSLTKRRKTNGRR